MTVLVWVVEGSWPAAVDAARALADHAGDDHDGDKGEDIVLLAVVETPEDIVRGAVGGLLGRRRDDATRAVARLAEQAADQVLQAAAARLGTPARAELRRGRTERAVVAAVQEVGADTLVLCRDGDLRRLGPASLGPHTRFVLDHAPCRVVLVWPGPAPDVSSIPAPPPHPPGHHPHPPVQHPHP